MARGITISPGEEQAAPRRKIWIKKKLILSLHQNGNLEALLRCLQGCNCSFEIEKMGVLSLHYPPVMTRFPSSSRTRPAMERSTSFSGQPLTFPASSNSKRCPDAGNLRCLDFRPLASGSSQGATGSNPKTAEAIKQEINYKDNDLVFVAGATGRVGSRTVRELLRLGFRVRAGVRSAQRAESLVQTVQKMKLDDVVGSSGTQPVQRLEIVECDLENQSAIGPAIGSASIVICCIGASEKEVFDVTGPYRIDYRAAKNLIEAATLAKVDHFILLTSLGSNKIGFPAAILNLFWGVLIWKRKAEEALIASGLPYTIVRPGGMERPTDSYKETHNIVLANEDTYFGGQVSNLQVAELMAFIAKNRKISLYKVVEVIAETTAPLTPTEVLLAKIPPQREIPDELQPDPVPLSTGSEPTKPVAEEEPTQIEELKERPLSPYAMYDDLKPPTSPTPTPSTTHDTAGTTSIGIINEHENSQITSETSSHQSPYHAYGELKPPTSPSPNAPITTSSIPTLASGGDSNTHVANESRDEKHIKQQKPRPLSPFTMYDDLKPPTSPLPSVPKY